MGSVALLNRLVEQIDEARLCAPEDWDLRIVRFKVDQSSHHHPPGISLYAQSWSGLTFEVPLQEGDTLAALFPWMEVH